MKPPSHYRRAYLAYLVAMLSLTWFMAGYGFAVITR